MLYKKKKKHGWVGQDLDYKKKIVKVYFFPIRNYAIISFPFIALATVPQFFSFE